MLKRIGSVIPSKSAKPILQCSRLKSADRMLRLSANGMDLSVCVTIDCDDDVGPCVVDARELTRRINANKNPTCSLRYDDERRAIVVNGGRVEHVVHTMAIEEFPIVATRPGGDPFRSLQSRGNTL